MTSGPCKEPTPPDSQISEALMTLPCEVIAMACAERFSFNTFMTACRNYGRTERKDNNIWEDDLDFWKTLKQDLDRTRFLAPQVLKEKMKQELALRSVSC